MLDDQATHGHCFVPYERLIRFACELLEVDDDDVVRRSVGGLLDDGDLVSELLDDDEVAALSPKGSSEAEDNPTAEDGHRAVYRKAFLEAERRVAHRLLKIAATPAADGKLGAFSEDRAAKAVEWVEDQLGVELGSDQRNAVGVALSQKVLLFTCLLYTSPSPRDS